MDFLPTEPDPEVLPVPPAVVPVAEVPEAGDPGAGAPDAFPVLDVPELLPVEFEPDEADAAEFTAAGGGGGGGGATALISLLSTSVNDIPP